MQSSGKDNVNKGRFEYLIVNTYLNVTALVLLL